MRMCQYVTAPRLHKWDEDFAGLHISAYTTCTATSSLLCTFTSAVHNHYDSHVILTNALIAVYRRPPHPFPSPFLLLNPACALQLAVTFLLGFG